MTSIHIAVFINAKMMPFIISIPKNARLEYKLVPTLSTSILIAQVDSANLVQMDISLIVIRMYAKNSKRSVLLVNSIIQLRIFACIANKIKSLTT
jgi:hypothetical protein